jgi:hypothetical protein
MQGAAAGRTFDHHHRSRQGHQQTVALGEVARPNRTARGLLADQQAAAADFGLKGRMVPGVNPFQWGAEHGDRQAPAAQAAGMGRPIDALRQTADHRPTGPGQGQTEGARHGQAMG